MAYLLRSQDNDDVGLKEAAKGLGIYVGSAINYWHISGNKVDQAYIDVAKKEYDLLTAVSTCKMKPIAKNWTDFDYTGCDEIMKFAEENDMAFRGHNTLWARDPMYPDFVK